MKILGITSPFSVNIAACLIEDGKIIAFAEEERFNKIKFSPTTIPEGSVRYCLKEAGINMDEIDYVAVGWDRPLKGWIKGSMAYLLSGNFWRIKLEMEAYLKYFIQMVRLRRDLKSLLKNKKKKIKIKFILHHIAHAASAARFSGFNQSIVMTLDGAGENDSGLLGYFARNRIHKIKLLKVGQSLGFLYSLTAFACGFAVHREEGKLMGLAAYGKPDLNLFKGFAELKKEGFELKNNLYYIFRKRFKERKKEEPIEQTHKNLAATAQYFLEEASMRLAKSLYNKTKIKNICLAGGVALNCDMNSKLMQSGLFENIFIQPAANDAGVALGAAAELYFQVTGKNCEALSSPYYGPGYSNEEIEKLLTDAGVKFQKINSLRIVAEKIYAGKIVGWFSGRMEFGPRALGGRSILANPSLPDIKDKINEKVKHRESWRPFSPSILAEYASEYFKNYHSSPYMLLTFDTKEDKINDLKAAIHIDNTARVQEVSKKRNPRYHELISEFYKISGIPALLNTSFNDRNEPIVMSPRDALQTFFVTGMDILVLEDYIIEK